MSSAEKEEVKMLIRGLLISVKNQMTVEDLRRDYKRNEGRDIPFSKLGYSSLLNFLQSIPDTVIIERRQGQYFVVPVTDENTSHIEALVSKQRSSTKQTWYRPPRRVARVPERFTQRSLHSAPCNGGGAFFRPRDHRSTFAHFGYHAEPPYAHYAPPPHVQPSRRMPYTQDLTAIQVPYLIQKNLKQLVMNNPQGLPMKRIEDIYVDMFHVKLPFTRLGFHSLSELALNIPAIWKVVEINNEWWVMPSDDTCCEERKPLYDDTWRTPQPLLSMNVSKPAPLHRSQPQEDEVPQGAQALTSSTMFDLHKVALEKQGNDTTNVECYKVPAGNEENCEFLVNGETLEHDDSFDDEVTGHVQGLPNSDVRLNQNTVQREKIGAKEYDETAKESGVDYYGEPFREKEPARSDQHEPRSYVEEDDLEAVSPSDVFRTKETEHVVSEKVKENFRKILSMKGYGIWCSQLAQEYKRVIGVDFNYKEYGFVNMIDLVSRLDDVFYVERADDHSDWMLFAARKGAERARRDDSDQEGVSCYLDNGVTPNIEENIRRLLVFFPQGLPINKFEKEYKKMFHNKLCCAEDLENYLQKLDGKYIRLRYTAEGVLVYSIEMAVNSPALALPPDGKAKYFEDLYPDDVVNNKYDLIYQKLPDTLEIENKLEVYVAEVFDLSYFIIQLRGTLTTKPLKKVMKDMQDFYSKFGYKYIMPPATIVVQQVCAALFKDKWHRAIITAVNENSIEILYYDFGTPCKVRKEDLRFLHTKFVGLPAQGISASLGGIRPVGGTKWSRKAIMRFQALVWGNTKKSHNFEWDKCIFAEIFQVNRGNNTVSVALVDTNRDNDIHINDVFVTENLAEYAPSFGTVSGNLTESPVEQRTINPRNLITLTPDMYDEAEFDENHGVSRSVSRESVQQVDEDSSSCNPCSQNASSSSGNTTPDSEGSAPALMQQVQQKTHKIPPPPPGFHQKMQSTTSTDTVIATENLQEVNSLNSLVSQTNQANVKHVIPPSNTQPAPAHANHVPPTFNAPPASSSVFLAAANPVLNMVQYLERQKREIEIQQFMLAKAMLYSMPTLPSLPFMQPAPPIYTNTPFTTVAPTTQSGVKITDVPSPGQEIKRAGKHEENSYNGGDEIEKGMETLTVSATRYIKKVEFGGGIMHIINIDQTAYVATEELNCIALGKSGAHALEKLLESTRVKIPFLYVKREERPKFFQELESYDIQGVTSNSILHLCPLAYIPQVLILLGKRRDMVDTFKEQVHAFDPSESYWFESS